MKRTAIAWALAVILTLGVTPAFAAGPLRDETTYPRTTVAPATTPTVSRAAATAAEAEVTPEPSAIPDSDASPSPSAAAYAPDQSIVSVSGAGGEPADRDLPWRVRGRSAHRP